MNPTQGYFPHNIRHNRMSTSQDDELVEEKKVSPEVLEKKHLYFYKFPLLLEHIHSRKIDVNYLYKWPAGGTYTALGWFSSQGKKDEVEALLKIEGIDVNFRADYDARTPLIEACAIGNVEIVRLLLAHREIDIDVDIKEDSTALHVAYSKKYNEIIELLIDYANAKFKKGRCEESLLLKACRGEDLGYVKFLLNHPKIDPNKKNYSGCTVLFSMSQIKNEEILKELFTNERIDLNILDSLGSSIIDCLFNGRDSSYHIGLLKELLDKSIRPRLNSELQKEFQKYVYNHFILNSSLPSSLNSSLGEYMSGNKNNSNDFNQQQYSSSAPSFRDFEVDQSRLGTLGDDEAYLRAFSTQGMFSDIQENSFNPYFRSAHSSQDQTSSSTDTLESYIESLYSADHKKEGSQKKYNEKEFQYKPTPLEYNEEEALKRALEDSLEDFQKQNSSPNVEEDEELRRAIELSQQEVSAEEREINQRGFQGLPTQMSDRKGKKREVLGEFPDTFASAESSFNRERGAKISPAEFLRSHAVRFLGSNEIDIPKIEQSTFTNILSARSFESSARQAPTKKLSLLEILDSSDPLINNPEAIELAIKEAQEEEKKRQLTDQEGVQSSSKHIKVEEDFLLNGLEDNDWLDFDSEGPADNE